MPDRADLTMPLRVLTAPKKRIRSATTLTGRAVLTGIAVALISVLVTALIAVPLAARAADREARDALAVQTQMATIVLRPRIDKGRTADELRFIAQLRKQDLTVYLISNGVPDRPGLPQRLVDQIVRGEPVEGRNALVDGTPTMVEGRPLGDDDGVVLTRPTGTGLVKLVLRNLWLPLLAGLLAGALAGVLLGRRLARPIRNAAIAAARLSSGDRTVRVRVEPPAEVERLAESINELAQALATSEGRQREFLLSISHELRTPLTTIRGYAEALADGVVTDDTATVGRTMLAEAERLDRLVADLLALARLEAADFPIELTGVELTSLVGGAAQAFGARCAKIGVLLQTEVPPHQVTVHSDPVRLRQIVDGLVENALRIVPPGRPIVLAVRAGGGRAVLEVRDGGPGLTDDDLGVAFERGALHQRYQGLRKVGSGLGLSLVAGLVRRLGGTVEAGHAREGGARFTVTLPH